MELTDFSAALTALREGKQAKRRGWTAQGTSLVYEGGKLKLRFATGDKAVWLVNQTDVLARDWIVDG